MVALVCVDGTGPLDPGEYDQVYSVSHTSDVFNLWPDKTRSYFRGPGIAGFATRQIAIKAYQSAKEMMALDEVTGLVMVGHSRGCAAIIEAARLLEQDQIEVDFMAFFDAVDMSTAVNAAVVPANVARVRHARRDPGTRSRPWWGNCGTRVAGLTFYSQEFFWGTHGAIGGVPHTEKDLTDQGYILEFGEHLPTKVTLEQDRAAAEDVWNYIWPAILDARSSLLSGRKWKVVFPQLSFGSQAPGAKPGIQPPQGGPASGGGKRYTVVSGDSLSLIAGRFWGDVLLWPILYDANRRVVGPNPNLIKPGQVLTIPDIRIYSRTELNEARSRGRNWR